MSLRSSMPRKRPRDQQDCNIITHVCSKQATFQAEACFSPTLSVAWTESAYDVFMNRWIELLLDEHAHHAVLAIVRQLNRDARERVHSAVRRRHGYDIQMCDESSWQIRFPLLLSYHTLYDWMHDAPYETTVMEAPMAPPSVLWNDTTHPWHCLVRKVLCRGTVFDLGGSRTDPDKVLDLSDEPMLRAGLPILLAVQRFWKTLKMCNEITSKPLDTDCNIRRFPKFKNLPAPAYAFSCLVRHLSGLRGTLTTSSDTSVDSLFYTILVRTWMRYRQTYCFSAEHARGEFEFVKRHAHELDVVRIYIADCDLLSVAYPLPGAVKTICDREIAGIDALSVRPILHELQSPFLYHGNVLHDASVTLELLVPSECRDAYEHPWLSELKPPSSNHNGKLADNPRGRPFWGYFWNVLHYHGNTGDFLRAYALAQFERQVRFMEPVIRCYTSAANAQITSLKLLQFRFDDYTRSKQTPKFFTTARQVVTRHTVSDHDYRPLEEGWVIRQTFCTSAIFSTMYGNNMVVFQACCSNELPISQILETAMTFYYTMLRTAWSYEAAYGDDRLQAYLSDIVPPFQTFYRADTTLQLYIQSVNSLWFQGIQQCIPSGPPEYGDYPTDEQLVQTWFAWFNPRTLAHWVAHLIFHRTDGMLAWIETQWFGMHYDLAQAILCLVSQIALGLRYQLCIMLPEIISHPSRVPFSRFYKVQKTFVLLSMLALCTVVRERSHQNSASHPVSAEFNIDLDDGSNGIQSDLDEPKPDFDICNNIKYGTFLRSVIYLRHTGNKFWRIATEDALDDVERIAKRKSALMSLVVEAVSDELAYMDDVPLFFDYPREPWFYDFHHLFTATALTQQNNATRYPRGKFTNALVDTISRNPDLLKEWHGAGPENVFSRMILDMNFNDVSIAAKLNAIELLWSRHPPAIATINWALFGKFTALLRANPSKELDYCNLLTVAIGHAFRGVRDRLGSCMPFSEESFQLRFALPASHPHFVRFTAEEFSSPWIALVRLIASCHADINFTHDEKLTDTWYHNSWSAWALSQNSDIASVAFNLGSFAPSHDRYSNWLTAWMHSGDTDSTKDVGVLLHSTIQRLACILNSYSRGVCFENPLFYLFCWAVLYATDFSDNGQNQSVIGELALAADSLLHQFEDDTRAENNSAPHRSLLFVQLLQDYANFPKTRCEMMVDR